MANGKPELTDMSSAKTPILARRRGLPRMPPAAADHDAFADDLAVAGQMLADHVDIVETALPDRNNGGVSDTSRFEAAELGPPQRHRRVEGGCRNHIRKRHAHAEEFRQRGHLVENRTVDAKRMNVRGYSVGIKAVG